MSGSKGNKYIYDIKRKILLDALGEVAPTYVQKVLNETWVQKAIEKALEYLGE